jgi:tRNA 5-methylaminomethyl-2-thiouridine biosynthesis bifunctional protein
LTHPAPLVRARPAYLADGTLYSPLYHDVYASAAGALGEARHVFLGGNNLPQRWRNRQRFVIVETGFGAGLNFLATWAAWRQSAPPGARLHYVSAEKHPFEADDLPRVTAPWPEVAPLMSELFAQYPPVVPGFHRMHFDGGRVTLTLLFGEAVEMLRLLEARTDAFYLDGFAPAKNPDMWSEDLVRELARLARPGATAATYSVAASVRAHLADLGFAVERRQGFGRKREMLVARFAGRATEEQGAAPRAQAAVIGAGLAGTSCAAQLAARGWQVELIERHSRPAQEASGNPAGLLMPAFSMDWNPATRLTVPASIYAAQWLKHLAPAPDAPVWEQSGVLQLARDPAHLERQRRIMETFALPDNLVRLVSLKEGSAICGAPVAGPGWWLRSAGWADPAAVCRANLAAAGEAVHSRFDCAATQLRRAGDDWELLDASGALLARAPVVILANAHAVRRLPGCEGLPLTATRGQVSMVRQRADRELSVPVCRDGYITPAMNGAHCLGASYDAASDDPHPRQEDHAANLDRLERLLPGFAAGLDPAALSGRVGFRTVSPDRLPLAGQVPLAGASGVFACLGLASRGLTWAPLLGEIIACCVTGEPAPVERNVLDWLAPQRFATRAASSRGPLSLRERAEGEGR